jgi:hypothetical protein
MPTDRLNTKKIIAYFGGRTPCHQLLLKGGFSVTKKALEKWQERGSIPLSRLLQLAEVDKKFCNRTFNISDFLE